MKFFIFLFLSLYTTVVCAKTDANNNKDSVAQYKLYQELKPEFLKYEKNHGHFIQTSNVKMHYMTWGNPKHIPLVWSHGTYSNGYELLEIIDSLVNMNFYVIAVDYYGHGLTPIPNKDVSIYHVADDIKFLMDNLKIKKAMIGGWSRGGSITTAFYDAYPKSILGLILEDGGSVAWDVNNHKESIDSLTKETVEYYKNKISTTYASEFDAYWAMYNYWGIKGKTSLKLKKEIFTCMARIKNKSLNKWLINPGVEALTGENTAEQELDNINRPFAALNLFGASTHLLYPKIVYRNLDIPMLIFDPLSKNDWFDFEVENTKLKNDHPKLITHKIYTNTWHGVKDEKPTQFVKDIREFLSVVKTFNKMN